MILPESYEEIEPILIALRKLFSFLQQIGVQIVNLYIQ